MITARALAAIAALVLPAAASAGPVRRADARVFPADGGASPATLQVPLASLVAAYVKRTGHRHFAKRIVIHKAQRRMDVYADQTLLKSYLIELGPAPDAPKQWQGDGRTPEGDLYVCSVNKVSHYTRFLALSYPAPADARRGLAAKRITAAQARAIEAAWRTRRACPPQTTALGGNVGIHGKGQWGHAAGQYLLYDWTLGCVGLRDADILELFSGYAEVGTPVHIE